MPSFEGYQATRHFASLNGLRFFCIVAVLWHHGPVWTSQAAPAQILTRGFVGVDFFFVLSGFLITTLLLREAKSNGQFSLRGFYWRRALRIIPVYFLVVTVVALYYIVANGETAYLTQLPYYYLFLSNFLTSHIPLLTPTWSLAVEEQYYLIWPLMLMLLPRKALIPALTFTIVINLAAVVGLLTTLGITAFEVGPLRFAMFNTTYVPILIGSMLALLLDREKSFDVLARLFGNNVAAIGVVVLLVVLLQWLPKNLIGWPNLVLHFVMAGALAAIVVREDNVLSPVLTVRPIARVGEISYGVYLYHLIGLHIANVGLGVAGIGDNGWLVFILYSLISIALAEISFRWFESYFLSFKHKGWGKTKR